MDLVAEDRNCLRLAGATPVTLRYTGVDIRPIDGLISQSNAVPSQPLDGTEKRRENWLTCIREDVADITPEWSVFDGTYEYRVLEVPPGVGMVAVLLGDAQ
jgi:hypothetical protein